MASNSFPSSFSPPPPPPPSPSSSPFPSLSISSLPSTIGIYKPQCKHIFNVSNFLYQHVSQSTIITDKTCNILDLLFTSHPSDVSKVNIIPGISDHEAISFIICCMNNSELKKKHILPTSIPAVFASKSHPWLTKCSINQEIRSVQQQLLALQCMQKYALHQNRSCAVAAGTRVIFTPLARTIARRNIRPISDRACSLSASKETRQT